MHEWMRWEPSRRRRPLASLVLAPSRVVVGVGAVVAVVASLLPWAQGVAPGVYGTGPVTFSGLGGAGDGFTLIVLATGAGLLTMHEAPATSRVRTVRLLPALLLVLAAATWINGYRGAQAAVEGWQRSGGIVGLAPGLWLAAAGIALMAAGTLPLLPPLIRWQPAEGDPSGLLTFSPTEVVATVAGILGVIVGGAAGVAVAVSLTSVPVIGLIELGAVFGGMLGAYGGTRLARTVLRAIRDARGR
jgi:hypothetical protein